MLEQRRRKTLPEQIVESSNDIVIKKTISLELLSTGSTLLDLACSDTCTGGFALGRMVNLIGDSSSGKTLLCLSMLAEACKNSKFNEYQIIFDDVEASLSFDIPRLFGQKLNERMLSPGSESKEPKPSDTIQQFQYNVLKALETGPCIYVLDSFDALSSDEEIKRVGEAIKAFDNGSESKGTYAMEKAKIGGRALAMIVRKLQKTKSIVIIISQTRDNIDPMSFQKKTRSGGKALKFYATHEIWMACGKKKKSKDRCIGVDAAIKVSKNKLTGKQREILFPVYYDYGIDNIGSCVDFLVAEGHWKKNGNSIIAHDLLSEEDKMMREKLIRHIEENQLERKLKRIVGRVWNEIEESLRLNRKNRYE